MIGIDSNILVRYITQDDSKQATRAEKLLTSKCSKDAPGFINRIVLCELAWVLEKAYHYSREQIVNTFEQLFTTTELEIDGGDEAWAALADFKEKNIDFSDAYIGYLNKAVGCEGTYTLDQQAAKRMDTFELC